MEYTKFNSALLKEVGRLDDNSKLIVKEIMDAYEDQLLVEFTCNLLRYFINNKNNLSEDLIVNISLGVCKIKNGKHRLFTHMVTAHEFVLEGENVKVNKNAIDEIGEIMIACEDSNELNFKMALISEKISGILKDYIYNPSDEHSNVIHKVFSTKGFENEDYKKEKSKIMKNIKEKENEYIQNYKEHKTNNIINIKEFKRNKDEYELDSKYKN